MIDMQIAERGEQDRLVRFILDSALVFNRSWLREPKINKLAFQNICLYFDFEQF